MGSAFWGPLWALNSPRFPGSDLQNFGGFTPDDDQLTAAVFVAGFGPYELTGITSTLERGNRRINRLAPMRHGPVWPQTS